MIFPRSKQEEINICNQQEVRLCIQVSVLIKKSWTSLQISLVGLTSERYKIQNPELQRSKIPKGETMSGWHLREELTLLNTFVLRSTSWKERRRYKLKTVLTTSLWKRNQCKEKMRPFNARKKRKQKVYKSMIESKDKNCNSRRELCLMIGS